MGLNSHQQLGFINFSSGHLIQLNLIQKKSNFCALRPLHDVNQNSSPIKEDHSKIHFQKKYMIFTKTIMQMSLRMPTWTVNSVLLDQDGSTINSNALGDTQTLTGQGGL